MEYYVLKLSNSDVWVNGYKNYKLSFSNSFMDVMMFYSLTMLNEFIEKYAKNSELEIYKIILKKI
jgi:hypothetical protein